MSIAPFLLFFCFNVLLCTGVWSASNVVTLSGGVKGLSHTQAATAPLQKVFHQMMFNKAKRVQNHRINTWKSQVFDSQNCERPQEPFS